MTNGPALVAFFIGAAVAFIVSAWLAARRPSTPTSDPSAVTVTVRPVEDVEAFARVLEANRGRIARVIEGALRPDAANDADRPFELGALVTLPPWPASLYERLPLGIGGDLDRLTITMTTGERVVLEPVFDSVAWRVTTVPGRAS